MQIAEKTNQIPPFPKDRDYLFDFEDNIYQVIGYIHLPDRVLCVKKYQKVSDPLELSSKEFTWSSRLTRNIYRRVIKQYSVQDVRDSMDSSIEFIQQSNLYGIPLVYFPKSSIKSYYSPRDRLSELYTRVSLLKAESFRRCSSMLLTALNVCVLLMEKGNLELRDLGITGSIMLEMDHAHSDIDLIVYGLRATRKVIEMAEQLPMESSGLRTLNYSEILQKTQEFLMKYKISEKMAVEIIKRKRLFVYYQKIPISIKFNPLDSEISNNPFASINSDLTCFKTLGSVHFTAEVLSVDWQYYYPSLIFIRSLMIIEFKSIHNSLEKSEKVMFSQDTDTITRLVIFEQDLSGFLKPGDRVEIMGLLQHASNVPDESRAFPQLGSKNAFQVVIGTKEMQGKEYLILI